MWIDLNNIMLFLFNTLLFQIILKFFDIFLKMKDLTTSEAFLVRLNLTDSVEKCEEKLVSNIGMCRFKKH